MNLPQLSEVALPEVDRLVESFGGEVRLGRHDRLLYATDASMYQVEPLAVLVPRTLGDVVTAMKWCNEHNVPLLPRGGGTSLAGQTVNAAVVLDCSAHLRGIGVVDAETQTVHVEPGAVLDDLQRVASEHGLRFGPEVSTSTHATLGGMINNRSAGWHWLLWGMTDAHVLGLDVVLADGRRVTLDRGAANRDPIVANLTQQVADVVWPLAEVIDQKFPKVERNVGGYALDRVLADLRASQPGQFDQVDLSGLFAGSEGTLGVVSGADLHLVPCPPQIGLSVLAFSDVSAALASLTEILSLGPSAVELLDHTVLDVARAHDTYGRLAEELPLCDGGPANAVLYVDWFAEDQDELDRRMDAVEQCVPAAGAKRFLSHKSQQRLWRLRKVGLGLILSGDESGQPVGGLEDCAVPPEHLASFQRDFESMLARHGLSATYYAHASVGLLHIRPRLSTSLRLQYLVI